MDEQSRDGRSYQQIGPWCRCYPHSNRCKYDSHISDCIISTEQPNSSNIGISVPEPEEDRGTGNIYNQRDDAKDAHYVCLGNMGCKCAVQCCGQNPQSH